MPDRAAPRAVASSRSGETRPCMAVGATRIGLWMVVPSTVVSVDDVGHVAQHAGPEAQRRQAATLSSRVISSPAPPAT